MGRCAHGVTRGKRPHCLSAPVFLRLRVQKGKVQALGLEGGKLGCVSALRRCFLFSVKRRRRHRRDLGIGTDLGSSRICWVAQPCLTLCDPMDCGPPGSSGHGILQARVLECIAISSSRGSSRPRDRTHISCILLHRQVDLYTVPPGKPAYDTGHQTLFSLKTKQNKKHTIFSKIFHLHFGLTQGVALF